MKTTKKHFKLFKRECKRWIKKLGLHDWEVSVVRQYCGDGNIAYCRRKTDSHFAQLSLCKTWPKNSLITMNKKNIKLAAFEEVCHVLLCRISSNAYSRFIMEHEINEAEHAVIRVLQNVLMI